MVNIVNRIKHFCQNWLKQSCCWANHFRQTQFFSSGCVLPLVRQRKTNILCTSHTENKRYTLVSTLCRRPVKCLCFYCATSFCRRWIYLFFRCCRLHANVLPDTLRGAPALCHRLLKMRLRLGAADRKKVPRGLEAVVTIMQFWN